MTPEQKAYYRARVEQAKNDTPSTSAFIWAIPVFIALALLCRTEPASPMALDQRDGICVMGVCL